MRNQAISKININDSVIIKGFASKWLLNVLDNNIKFNDKFFECVQYCCNDLKPIVNRIIDNLKSTKIPKIQITNLKTCSANLVPDALENLLEEYPFLASTVKVFISQALEANLIDDKIILQKNSPLYQFKEMFGINNTEIELCYFLFLSSEFDEIEDFFRVSLDIFRFDNDNLMASILNIDNKQCKDALNKLYAMGLLHTSHLGPTLTTSVADYLKGISESNLKKILCSPIADTNLTLDDFPIDKKDIDYVIKLLSKKHNQPVHVLLAGPCGNGKSSFVRALAKHLKIKTLEVITGFDKDTNDRKMSLTACLNIAQASSNKDHPCWVLVDEAESLLDVLTDDGHGTSAKAWINSMMEQKNNRVIWIVNSTSFIDDSVKRRFSYSIYFKRLTLVQQVNMWSKIIKKQKVESKLPIEEAKRLAITYSAPVSIIESSIKYAKITASKNNFVDYVERNIKSYTTLINNGYTIKNQLSELDKCVINGINTDMPVDDILSKIKYIDNTLKQTNNVQPGMLNILFSGISGSGKTFLSKYIAKYLGRPCIIKRSSSLLSKWVGETEQLIREAFEEANEKNAILVFDEADIFIPNRETTHYGWENSMTAEMLVNLEENKTICIFTTNLASTVDKAAIRRFTLKVTFDYATPANLVALYQNILAPFVGSVELDQSQMIRLQAFRNLCVGDFAVVKKQILMSGTKLTHDDLLDALANEERIKRTFINKKLGFVA